MNTTHIWNSQTCQLEKEAVLLKRHTTDVWSFQTFSKPATQLQSTDFNCQDICDDDSNCLEACNKCKQKKSIKEEEDYDKNIDKLFECIETEMENESG